MGVYFRVNNRAKAIPFYNQAYLFEIIQEYRSNIPVYYCAIIMSIVPILILFCCFQETIMENTVAGGLKG